MTATESSIELGENQAVDFKVGTQGTVVLSDTSFTLLRNSTFTNNGTITTDYASTITVGGTFTNSGTITVGMAGAAANGVYKLIDNAGYDHDDACRLRNRHRCKQYLGLYILGYQQRRFVHIECRHDDTQG
ncbi:MAG: hypothetical protein V8T87_17390 [Victivallales bacterium]